MLKKKDTNYILEEMETNKHKLQQSNKIGHQRAEGNEQIQGKATGE